MTAVAKDNQPRPSYLLVEMLSISQRHLWIVVAPDQQRRLFDSTRVALNSFRVPATDRANDGPVSVGRAQRSMARFDSPFIKHPRMPLVHSSHAASQKGSRPQQKW